MRITLGQLWDPTFFTPTNPQLLKILLVETYQYYYNEKSTVSSMHSALVIHILLFLILSLIST